MPSEALQAANYPSIPPTGYPVVTTDCVEVTDRYESMPVQQQLAELRRSVDRLQNLERELFTLRELLRNHEHSSTGRALSNF